MHTKGTHSSEHIRVSVSSTHSASSSHGSAPDDFDSLGEVYIWGETLTLIDPLYPNPKIDSLLPKPLESNLVLDARHVACGSGHAALITRHGEIFTWGQELSGRLGHGLVGNDIITPTLIDTLSAFASDSVSCGEFHTCAITNGGDLYMWGVGHGNDDVSHWIPKRVSGLIDGLRVEQVSCGTYHTALITSTGQLFTFGDGLFGVLGHGNRDPVSHPKEVESLSGLKTVFVSCGVWHTAAVVEVMANSNSCTNSSVSSGKLFTWGDGDKHRLGHGDRDPRLKPTCVASLIDHNFQKIACGHSLTVGLTTTGQVLTMGSTVYGQLGNPRYDGRLPCLIEDNLIGETVCDISCGAYHVAVLTTKGEVYSWGKGANGRLGHGDLEDRKVPTLVEALKDRAVRQIACGTSFTACVCLRRWVPGSEQSQCANCRLAFGFTRKRHHCYNCGLVHCHTCSSKKALGADLAPNPSKPYRVCDLCYAKLSKALPGLDIIRSLDLKAAARQVGNRKHDNVSSHSLIRTTHLGSNSILQLRDFAVLAGDLSNKTGYRAPIVRSLNPSRAASPFSRMHSPPRSVTPVPVSLSKAGTESLRKTNELLTLEVEKLRSQVESLKQKCDLHEAELQRSAKKVQEAVMLAAEESAKSKAAKEVIKSLTAQLKEMAERLPEESQEESERKSLHIPNGISDSSSHAHQNSANAAVNGLYHHPLNLNPLPNPESTNQPSETEEENVMDRRLHEEMSTASSAKELESSGQLQNGEIGSRVRIGSSSNLNLNVNQAEAEWIEQYEPGVYITLTALRDGTRDLKRVRFSRRRFGEHQAESWWWENREKVYEKYNVRGADRAPSIASLRSIH